MRDVVADYRRFHAPVAKAEIAFYATLAHADAVARSARAERPDGKRHDHQRRISRKAIREVGIALASANLKGLRGFSKLYQELAARTRRIKGIGPLFVYDTAVRIGANLKLYPATVYVHAGVKKGVRAVIRGNMRSTVSPNDFRLLFHAARRLSSKTCSASLAQCCYKCADCWVIASTCGVPNV